MITPQQIEFIKKSHLFRGLKDEDVALVAGKMEERVYEAGKAIVVQGTAGDRFFMIYSGKVRVDRQQGKNKKELATLSVSDYFGEDSLLHHQHRSATVTALEETTVLTLSRESFQELIKRIRNLRARFEVTVASHKLTQRRQFKWLEDGEVVYFITRKHVILLYRALVWPVLGFIFLPLVLYLIFTLTKSFVPLWISAGLMLYLVGLIIWKVIDWGNDYYIVTNRRVVWLEKVIGLYDSRQESPLTAILSVNSETDMTGRMIGYGDVIVRTFVGKIVFDTVGHPDEVVTLLREYWERTKDVAKRANVDAMKQAIRQKLGVAEPKPPAPPPPPPPKKKKMTMFRAVSASMFKIRYEEKGSVTYRKHWVVWVRQTWLPGVIGIFLLIWLFYNLLILRPDSNTFSITLFFLFIIVFFWWLYQTMDWSNDIFQVTSDQILDIDKTPFGKIRKNVAPLDNILNTEARRNGIWQNLFNYGNVFITVGGSTMVFEDVMDPASVQQDIDRRRVARKDKQEADKAAAERDRLAEFFALYHTNAEEFNRELEEKRKPVPPTDGTSGQS